MMDKEKELRPCPFCGGQAHLIVIPPHKHEVVTWMPECKGEAFIECTSCTCAMSANTKEEAIAAWNRRRGYKITIEMPRGIGTIYDGKGHCY